MQVFPCEFCEISKKTFFTEHFWATASAFSCHLIYSQLNIFFLVFFFFKNCHSHQVVHKSVPKVSRIRIYLIFSCNFYSTLSENHWKAVRNFIGTFEENVLVKTIPSTIHLLIVLSNYPVVTNDTMFLCHYYYFI